MYLAGKTIREVSAATGIGTATVQRCLRASGVDTRRRYGSGPAAGNWRGGRISTGQGYVWVWCADRLHDPLLQGMFTNNRYVLEHRLVMAEHLGRPLRKDETVHHINGIKDDNRLENLQLRSGAHGSGVALQCDDCGSRSVSPVALA